MAKTKAPRKPQDATRRNIRAANTRFAKIEARLKRLERALRALGASV